MPEQRRALLLLLASFVLVLAWSAVHPHDYFTWALEVFPAVIALGVLAVTYRRFQFTTFVYVLVLLHACILFVGGRYTYAEVPAFNWIRDHFHLARNHYDRLGHFAQGFVPAILAREILLRKTPLPRGRWLFFLVTCVCLSFSAVYEFVEWWTAVGTGEAATAFLGTQGDPWDTQWDMFLALVGALTAQLLLARVHDRQLAAQPREGYAVTP